MRQIPAALLLAAVMTASVVGVYAEGDADEPYAEDLGSQKKTAKPELPGVKAPATPKASCLVSGAAAEAVGCAGAYQKVSDGFLDGYKAMDAWVGEASSQVSASADKVSKIEDQIKANESSVTTLKLDRSKDAKLKLKELDKANKQLWKDLDAARREQDALCKGFARAAAVKVKELTSDITKRLAEAQKAQ